MANIKEDISCPTCGKKDTWHPANTARPFCSDRCKLIDLGEWADEQHRIPGDTIQTDEENRNQSNETNF